MAKVIYFKNVGNEHAQLNIQYHQIYIYNINRYLYIKNFKQWLITSDTYKNLCKISN